MSDNMKLSKDKRHRSSSSIAGAGIDTTRSERNLEVRGLVPEVGDYFALAESRCDDLQEKIDLLKVLKRKKKMSKRSMTRVDGAIPESPVPLISVRTQPKKKVSGQAARLRRVEGPAVAAGAGRGYVDPAYVEQHRMLGQVWAADRKTPQNEYQAGSRAYQSPRARRNRADGDGMCGQKMQAEVVGIDDANAYRDHQALSDIFHQDSRKFTKKNAASGSSIDRAKLSTPGNHSGNDAPVERRRPVPTSPPPHQQYQRPQQAYQHPYQQQLSLPKINERPVVELFNKNRQAASPPLLVSPRSHHDSRPDDRDKAKTNEEATRSDLIVGQSAASAEPYKKIRRKPWSRSYDLPTVASQLKQVEARQSRSGAVTNSSYIPFVVSKNTGPSYNIGINVQQVLNGMKIQQPLKDIPLTIAHHMGLGHIPTYKTKRVNILQKLERPSLSRCAINSITMGARTLTLPSRRSISYNRLLSMYSSGDGMVSRFLRANARVTDYLYTSLYETREPAESSEQSVPSEQAESQKNDLDERNEQDERAECERRASASKSARARHRRRYQQLAQLYREYKRLERMHEDGAGNEETARRYNEIIRILRANKDYMAQQEMQAQRKSSMPRKTSTNTTLVSSGADRLDRESSPVAQVDEWARVSAGRPPSGAGSKASDVRLSHSHYPPGDSRPDLRKTPTLAFH